MIGKGKGGTPKYTIGSVKDASVYGQAKGAAKDFGPKESNVKTKSGGKGSVGTSSGGGKGFSPPPQKGGGKADKVSGTPGAKSAQDIAGPGGKKLGNHYSNS